MDLITLRSLEFPALLNIVAEYASSAAGAEAVRSLVPVTDAGLAQRQYEPVEELLDLLIRDQSVPLNGLVDAQELWLRLGHENAYLQPEEWLAVRRILEAGERVLNFFTDHEDQAPRCAQLAVQLTTVPALTKEIRRVIDEDGSVRDAIEPNRSSVVGSGTSKWRCSSVGRAVASRRLGTAPSPVAADSVRS